MPAHVRARHVEAPGDLAGMDWLPVAGRNEHGHHDVHQLQGRADVALAAIGLALAAGEVSHVEHHLGNRGAGVERKHRRRIETRVMEVVYWRFSRNRFPFAII
jgi:hypothetical protein